MRRFICIFALVLALALAGVANARLAVTNLAGFGASQAVAGGPVAISFRTTAASTSDTDSYDYGTLDIGTASSDRIVVVVALGTDSSSGATTDDVSIAGASGTEIVESNYDAGGNSSSCAIWGRLVTAGTTGNITVTYSQAMQRAGVAAYALTGTGGSLTAHATGVDEDGSDPLTVSSFTTPANGGAIGGALNNTAGGDDFTWTNLTENSDFAIESATGSTASKTVSSQVTETITADYASAATRACMAVVSWGPG